MIKEFLIFLALLVALVLTFKEIADTKEIAEQVIKQLQG